MMLVECHDSVEHALGLLDRIFRLITPNPAAMEIAGIRAISEKITGLPGWYFWLNDHPGVYALELFNSAVSNCFKDFDEKHYTGNFVIKYYPPVGENNYFETFSKCEQILRLSDFFDSTGAPKFDTSEDLPLDLFLIGFFTIAGDRSSKMLTMNLNAPSLWETIPEVDIVVELTGYETIILRKNIPDRGVPAWELSFRLFDVLAKAVTLAFKRGPEEVKSEDMDGHSIKIDLQGRSIEVANSKIRNRLLGVQYNVLRESVPILELKNWMNREWLSLANLELPIKAVAPC
jgi:hypothetical protein